MIGTDKEHEEEMRFTTWFTLAFFVMVTGAGIVGLILWHT